MSDQDFFFDEDEKVDEEVAEKPASKKANGKPAPRQTAPRQSAAGYSGGGQSVTMTVASLIAVVALLVGVIIGILIPAGASTPTSPAANTSGSVSAPQLTDEQIQGGVPEGHPDISGMATGTAEATTTP